MEPNPMSPIDPLSPSDQNTPYSNRTNEFSTFFTDAFNFMRKSVPSTVVSPTIMHINTKTVDDSDEIVFEPQGNTEIYDTYDIRQNDP
jgi:hypothetical protein